MPGLIRKDALDCVNDGVDVFFSQDGMQRQAHDTPEGRLSMGEIPFLIAIPFLIKWKKVQRNIVDTAFNVLLTHHIDEFITADFEQVGSELDNVEVPRMAANHLFPDG